MLRRRFYIGSLLCDEAVGSVVEVTTEGRRINHIHRHNNVLRILAYLVCDSGLHQST